MLRGWTIVVAVGLLASGCALRPAAAPSTPGTTCEYRLGGTPAKAVDPPSGANVPNTGTVVLTLRMSDGDVKLTLDRAKAPCGVNSFENLARQNFFDATDCHRLYDSGIFALQCGDPSGTGDGGPGYTFSDEITPHDSYPKGSVVEVNRGADTNGSQFLLVYGDSPIQGEYTIIGTMDEASVAVIGNIAEGGQDGRDAATGGGGLPNFPATIVDVVAG